MKRVIDIAALVPYPLGRAPGQRYRIEQWAPLLEDLGVRVHMRPFLSSRGMDVLYRRGSFLIKTIELLRGHIRRFRMRRTLADFHCVYVYREASLLGSAWLERIAARESRLVFDFDDAIWLPDTSPANRWVAPLKKAARKAEAICGRCACAVAGNEYLAAWAAARAPRVAIVPSTIDTDWYRPGRRPASPRPILGWTGSITTAAHLEFLAEPLRELSKRHDFELLVVGAEPTFSDLRVRAKPWSARTEVEDLQEIDIGLMPLPDDPWSRGKCGMKALQFMALGIPPVVSPVGANASIVADGLEGFHARYPAEWIARIELLLKDAPLRQRLGLAARQKVERCFSGRVQSARFADILRSVSFDGTYERRD